MTKSATKVFGVGDREYKTLGQGGLATRKKIDAEKVALIRAWKRGLVIVLKVGTGLNTHLDVAMRELVEELQEWIDAPE